MIRRFLIFIILGTALFMSSRVFALDPNSQGELGAYILASDSPDYMSEWVHTQYNHDIHIVPIKEVIPDQKVHTAFVVTGYGADDKGMTDLAADFVLQGPDGKEVFGEKNVATHHKKRGKESAVGFIMLDPAIYIVLEANDKRGVYTIKASVTDKVLNKTASCEYKFTFVDAPAKKKTDDGIPAYLKDALSKEGLTAEDIDKVTTYYYLDSQPNKLIKVLKFLINQEELIADPVHFGPVEHLFATVAHSDKTVLSSIKDLEGQYSGKQKERMNEIILQAENFVSPDSKTAENLDYLWSEFCATGKDEPIQKIISALNYSGKNVESRIVAGAAEWSLTSNAAQHKKVYDIIQSEYLYSNDAKTREKLSNILKKVRR